MNKLVGRADLDDVLDGYMTEADSPGPDILVEWIRRYPQYERELMECAVAWAQTEWAPKSKETEVDDQTLVLRGMSIVKNLLHNLKAAPVPTAENRQSLVSAAAAKGMTLDNLATRMRLSPLLVRKLDLGRIAAIPSAVVERFVQVAGVDRDTAAVRFRGPQQFAMGGKFRASQTPALGERQDFSAAVQGDPEMSEEDKAYWLSAAVDENQASNPAP